MSDAESILRKVLDEIVEKQQTNSHIAITPLSTSGAANYTSQLFMVTLKSHLDELKLFAKVATVKGKMREIMRIETMFSNELYAYDTLSKAYDNIQDKHNVEADKRFVFPKYYGGNIKKEEETVVMEDLKTTGFGTYTRYKSIDWEHTASAIEELAKFHALSFAFQKEDPENFEKACIKLAYVSSDSSKDPDTVQTWGRMMSSAVQVCGEEFKEKLKSKLLSKESMGLFNKFRNPLGTKVLCHGDYKASNLLFRRQNGRLETIVVDYQTLHTGSPVADLLYLELLDTDQRFRDEHHQQLLDYYFQQLSEALDRLGLDVAEVYPRETFDKEWNEMLPVMPCIAAVVLPLVLVEAQRAPSPGNVADFSDLAISPTELFAERYGDLVADCAKWGAL